MLGRPKVWGKTVGVLYDVVQLIERTIVDRGLDEHRTKGLISLHSGILASAITPDTPDDPERVSAFVSAAERVLGSKLPVR